MKYFLLFAIAMISLPLHAHNLPVGATYESDYIQGSGQYRLYIDDKDEVTFTHDPNRCAYTRLGEMAGICTAIGLNTTTSPLQVVPVAANKMTLVYKLKGDDFNQYQFVLRLRDETIRLLKIDSFDRVYDVIILRKTTDGQAMPSTKASE